MILSVLQAMLNRMAL